MLRFFYNSAILTLVLALFSCEASAAGNLSVSKTIAVDAPAAKVWVLIKEFDALNKWHPAVTRVDILKGENNQVGTVRLLTLTDGGTIKEELLSWDNTEMKLSYKIIEGVLPVSNYESTLSVDVLTENSCKIIWSGSFSAGNGADDKTARETIGNVYDSGLENLVKITGKNSN